MNPHLPIHKSTLHSLVQAAVSNVKCVNGTQPIIMSISNTSPLSLYANSDFVASAFENPWDIIYQLSIHQNRFTQHSIRPRILDSAPHNHSEQPRTIKTTLHSNIYNIRQAIPPKPNHVHPILGKRKRNERSNTSELPCTRRKTIHPYSVHRSPHFRTYYLRVFSHEIQSIMHAFGEVRHSSPTVLEFIERTVRNVTQRVALGILSRFNTEELTVSNISTCIRRDPNALYRLLYCLLRARLRGEDVHIVRPIHRDWDSFLHHATIQGMTIPEFPSLNSLQLVPMVKTHNKCAEIAKSIFWSSLGVLFKLQHKQGIQASLTDRESRYPLKGIQGRRRIDIFREWLALPEYVQMNEGSLHALGNLTREAIGIITQTALVLRLRPDTFHSYEQLLVIALGYGIAAGVALPLSGMQTFELLNILEDMHNRVERKEEWTVQVGQKGEALQIKYVKEAWRQLDDPDAIAAHRPFWFGL